MDQPKKTSNHLEAILSSARWCFLNFGFSKTSLEDIAKRANVSRTLLYRFFKGKEEIFKAVFVDWLVTRHPEAQKAAAAKGDPYKRLLTVCKVMAFDPWLEMVRAPMGSEFFEACGRVAPEADAHHHKVALECVSAILGDDESAHVFIMAINGLLADKPEPDVLESRIKILADRFTRSLRAIKKRPSAPGRF
ncbi:MAG: TetR/AcrR family transcriptional regulator [Deltaproteobacteria bacterium]|jgi:AcrR family transcriptional regulator|nr:TetR/AcrR family transcriptional regulator [Deltaproteobacteria bacterium]